jgi:hypothetical protein
MDPRFRKVAVFVGAAALATGVGVGVASQGDETASSQAASPQVAGAPGARGGPREMDLSALAEQLGVTTDKLQAAMQAARSSTGGAPQPGDREAMAAALAKELGLSTDKVSAAVESLRPQGAPGGTPPSGAAPPDDSTTGTTAA